MTLACIFGLQGPSLTEAERRFFRKAQPWGFILFRRNIETPDQVRALTASLRDLMSCETLPILIDQEGGRVQRLGPPHWPVYPAGRAYGQANEDRIEQQALTRLGARLMAADLVALGINVDCVPVLDVPAADGHEVIGDRAYGVDAASVAALGRAACEGLIAGGVLPVIKHIPGHGRAMADSHLDLPVVDAAYDALDAVDFAPFKALSDMPMGMTAHVVYAAVDPKAPATTSRKAVRKVIRGAIGFDGLLMSDDLSMKALGGDFGDRTRRVLDAGCDLVLHCNGDMAEMKAVAGAARPLSGKSRRRADAALARLPRTPEPLDEAWARARFAKAFPQGGKP